MEALLSRSDTLFRRNSTIFRKIASRQQMEIKILVENIYIPLASTPEQDIDLGQSSKMRLHWPLDIILNITWKLFP
jgi:hypothetical protein